MATKPKVVNFQKTKNPSICSGEWKVDQDYMDGSDPRYFKLKQMDLDNYTTATFASTKASGQRKVNS